MRYPQSFARVEPSRINRRDLGWRGGRVAEGTPLLREHTPKAYREFESRPLRHIEFSRISLNVRSGLMISYRTLPPSKTRFESILPSSKRRSSVVMCFHSDSALVASSIMDSTVSRAASLCVQLRDVALKFESTPKTSRLPLPSLYLYPTY